MTESEVDIAERNVRNDIAVLKRLMSWLLVVVFIALAIISATGIVAARVSSDTKQVSQQNNTFLGNFSDYMRCLVVNDDKVVLAVGEEAYFNLCDALLFRGTGQEGRTATKVTIPPDFPTTTSTGPAGIFVDPDTTTTKAP